ncbi:MAG: hypothetical protein WB711_21530 [Terriglobales bacterium]
MTNKSIISAVHDDDLVGFLESLGVLSDVKRGEARCKFCREVISLDNLVAVFPESGDIKFVCDRPGCLALLAEHRSELRGRDRRDHDEHDAEPPGEVARAKGHVTGI